MAKREVKPVAAMPAEEPVAAPKQPLVSFDVWWAMVQKNMPQHHSKEVVLADFGARGLRLQEPMAAYNKALALYGIKLK